MVLSIDVFLEHGTVLGGHWPSLLGLNASTNGNPPRLPQIVTPSNSVIYKGGLNPIYLRQMHLTSEPQGPLP